MTSGETLMDVRQIDILDVFAGPGGIGEGFSRNVISGQKLFKIKLSIEKERSVIETLRLRSFFRQFTSPPKEYYQNLRGESDCEALFDSYPDATVKAKNEVWQFELGGDLFSDASVQEKISQHFSDCEVLSDKLEPVSESPNRVTRLCTGFPPLGKRLVA